MSKFKIGDIVRGISDNYGVTNRGMTAGRVMSIKTHPLDNYELTVTVIKHRNRSFIGKTFSFLNSKDFELVEAYQDWKVVILPRGNTTIAKLYKNNAVVKTVECKKHPDDEYSMDEAIKVVTERLREPEKPQYYNGKVVCINNQLNDRHYTVGRIYQFKDGKLTTNDGIKFPLEPMTSFAEFQKRSYSKWLEVVE